MTPSQPPKKKSKTTSSKDTEETEAQGLATTLASSGLELTEGWQGAKEPKGNAIMPRLAKLLEQRNADGSKKHQGNDIVAELNAIAKDDLNMKAYEKRGLFNATAISNIRHGHLDITQGSRGLNPDRLTIMSKLLERYEIE